MLYLTVLPTKKKHGWLNLTRNQQTSKICKGSNLPNNLQYKDHQTRTFRDVGCRYNLTYDNCWVCLLHLLFCNMVHRRSSQPSAHVSLFLELLHCLFVCSLLELSLTWVSLSWIDDVRDLEQLFCLCSILPSETLKVGAWSVLVWSMYILVCVVKSSCRS